MATQMSFQSLDFGDIAGQEREANRRLYDSLGSAGKVIADFGANAQRELDRKYQHEKDKREWDRLVSESERQRQYRADRDAITDARYKEELDRELEKQRQQEEALANAKKDMTSMPSPDHIGVMYGPQARTAYYAMQNAPTYADFMSAQKDLNQAIYQKQMMREQRRQYEYDNAPNRVVNQVNSNLSRGGVDVRGSSVPMMLNEDGTKYVPDPAAIEEQLKLIDAELERLNIDRDNESSSALRQALINKKAALNMALHPTAKVQFVPGWNNFGSYTK